MMDKVKNVPELRFEGFTDDWKQRKLGDYAEIITGGTPSTLNKNYWYPKEIPWMSSGEVNKSRLNNTENKISKFGFGNSNAKWIPVHSVLIALAGQGKTRGMVAVNNIPLTTNQSIAGIITNQELHYEFLFQNLINRYEELRLMSSGDGTRGGLNKQIIGNIEFLCPTLAEQKAIGDFFKQLDSTIDFHQRTQNKYKNLKNAYLEKLFSNKSHAWVQRKLKEFGKDFIGGGTPNTRDENYWKGNLAWIQSSDLQENKFSGIQIRKYISEKALNNSATKYVPANSIAIVTRVGVGKVCLMPFPYSTSQDFLSISNIQTDEWFAVYAISRLMQNESNSTQGTSIKGITKDVLLEKILDIPSSITEQKAIGEFFRQLDDTITTHQRELLKYQQLKEILLKKMFV